MSFAPTKAPTGTKTSLFKSNFTSIASSASGEYVYAVSVVGRALVSKDLGVTWAKLTALENASPGAPWISVSTSSTGIVSMATRANNGGWAFSWWLSTDFGQTWTGVIDYMNAASGYVSGNGQYIAAVVGSVCCNNWHGEDASGMIIISNTSGSTWPIVANITRSDWIGVSSSYDGRFWYAASSRIGIYRSVNFGVDWSLLLKSPSCWTSIASDSTGSFVGATSCNIDANQNGGCVYISTNGGGAWRSGRMCSGSWASISTSTTGEFWTIAQHEGYVYHSSDYGHTWFKTNASVTSQSFTSSATIPGTAFLTTNPGYIYKVPTAAPTANPSSNPTFAPTIASSNSSLPLAKKLDADVANTFTFSGQIEAVTAPSDVCSLLVYMWGAGGGASYSSGGAGAYVEGTLPVTPGQQLNILVGQAGGGNGVDVTFGGGGAMASYGGSYL